MMAGLVKITVRLRNDEMRQSIRMLSERSRRLPSYIVNKAVTRVARAAADNMPVVTTGQMDSELNALVTPRLSSRGPRRGMSLKSGKKDIQSFGPVGAGAHPDVPLAALIIQARVIRPDVGPTPGVKGYNIRTGFVFARTASPFRGVSRAAGAALMLDAMKRMLSARHKSGGFFRTCALVVWQIFRPAASKNPIVSAAAMTGFDAVPSGGGSLSKAIGRLAGGTVATDVGYQAHASFWVAATEPDTKGVPGGAIYRIAQPVWQRAVDDEAASIRQYAESLYAGAARESGFTVR